MVEAVGAAVVEAMGAGVGVGVGASTRTSLRGTPSVGVPSPGWRVVGAAVDHLPLGLEWDKVDDEVQRLPPPATLR